MCGPASARSSDSLAAFRTVRFFRGATSNKRVANIGNAFFAAMKLRIVLNYRDRQITFYAGCGDSAAATVNRP